MPEVHFTATISKMMTLADGSARMQLDIQDDEAGIKAASALLASVNKVVFTVKLQAMGGE